MNNVFREISAILSIAHRDVLKFLRDPYRIIGMLALPIIIVGVLGGTFQANVGNKLGYNFLVFTFTGVFAQTLFQSTSLGIVSLLEDRDNNFSQEIFISPISRYSIVFGNILGESVAACCQAVVVVGFGLLIGIPFTVPRILAMFSVAGAVCLLGGTFGLIFLSIVGGQRSANQFVPFLIFPQLFLAGVFTPIQVLPWYIDILSKMSPLRYAVDLVRDIFYAGQPEYRHVILAGLPINLTVIATLFLIFLLTGTMLFVRSEQNR